LNLIEWFVEMAINSGATSWSMEEVASKHAIQLIESIRQKHRSSVAYGVFYFDELGVPQTRKRLLAGSPHLISKLQRLRCATKRRTIGDVVEKPRGTHLRGTVSSKGQRKKARIEPGEARYVYKKAELGEFCRAIDEPSLTIPTHGMAWITKEPGGKAHTRLELYAHEAAAIQTFPSTYKWPDKKVIAMRQVGNAVTLATSNSCPTSCIYRPAPTHTSCYVCVTGTATRGLAAAAARGRGSRDDGTPRVAAAPVHGVQCGLQCCVRVR